MSLILGPACGSGAGLSVNPLDINARFYKFIAKNFFNPGFCGISFSLPTLLSCHRVQ
jgi:hypothetical protein